MHILVLASENPRFDHLMSGGTVLATLLEEFTKMGHKVSFSTAACPHPVDVVSLDKLQKLGVYFLRDFSDALKFPSKNIFLKFAESFLKDFPVFQDPKKVIAQLRECRADLVLLYLDTIFHHLVPFFQGVDLIGYFGRPPYSSAVARYSHAKGILKYPRLALLKQRERRYLARSRFFSRMGYMCRLDAVYFQDHGIPCEYVSNTWPDLFGSDWFEKRRMAEEGNRVRILANIGTVHTTGNTYGLQFLADAILPKLDTVLMERDWEINICGGGAMSPALRKKLNHPRVNIKGFVPDMDAELLRNQIFLLLNNAGPHTGGYTRVVYAFSSGACLIAHANLALSMPEMIQKSNVLMGRNAEEIISWLREAVRNPVLRKEIGNEARNTYQKIFHPKKVAEKILKLGVYPV